MNIFSRLGNRLYQLTLYLGMVLFIRVPLPALKEGKGCSKEIGNDLIKGGWHKPLFFIEGMLKDLGLHKEVEDALLDKNIVPIYFTHIKPNPSTDLVEEAIAIYREQGCDCLICLGGGSTIDLAKAVGVLAAYPNKKIGDFEGILKIHRQIPPLFALPTTAGTGSETTLASVIVDEKKLHKYQIDSPYLVPKYAYLDPSYLSKLPKSVIASTGMDALTHALEAYFGRSNTRFTKRCALSAIQSIGESLHEFYLDPSNEAAAMKMLRASFDAGNAFTRAYVGYVHALAHALGGFYGVPHGLANAVLLPYVLRDYGDVINKKATKVLEILHLLAIDCSPYEALCQYIDDLNASMGIPKQLELPIKEEDYPLLARHAAKEGNPLYPVPSLRSALELEDILRRAIK